MSDLVEIWTDGSSNYERGISGAAAIVKFPNSEQKLSKVLNLGNCNAAELEAIKLGLEWLLFNGLEYKHIICYCDNLFCVRMLARKNANEWLYKANKHSDTIEELRKLVVQFRTFAIVKVEGHNKKKNPLNSAADRLASECYKNFL